MTFLPSTVSCFFLPLFTLYNLIYNIYGPFLDENLYFRTNSFMTPFCTQFVLSHAYNNTTSRNIGGKDAGAVPHFKVWGTIPHAVPSKSPPMSLTDITMHTYTTT